MKARLVVLAWLLSVLSAVATEPDGTTRYAKFMQLPKEQAATSAREMARQDFTQGRFLILVYGLRRQDSPSEIYLLERYGVAVTPIAGCIVSPGVTVAAESYNATMKPLLRKKFGRDIFAEAAEATRK
jgi:hypothetical protein